MDSVLVDSCILLDLFTADPTWADWSEATLESYSQSHFLCINSVIYAEASVGFERLVDVDEAIAELGVTSLDIPRKALFLAGKAFLRYRRNEGKKHSPLPDFFIGAHALASDIPLITRDVSNYRTYFPKVHIVSP